MLKFCSDFLSLLHKDKFILHRIKFYFQVFLIFCFFFSFIHIELLDFFKTILQRNPVISFIAHNQDLILNLLSVFLLFQAFATILFFISFKTNAYAHLYKALFLFLISIQFYFLLFLQIFYNLQIISINAFLLMDYFFSGTFIYKICFFSHCLNMAATGLLLLGFIYQKE